MSGGSFNYLCHTDASDIVQYGKREDLERMADELRGRGFGDAARETYTILLDLKAWEFRTEAAINRLNEIWRAVEWHVSCDSGPEAVDDAVAKYRGLEFPPLPEGHRDVVRGMCECGDYTNRCPARVEWQAERHRALVTE